MKDSDKRVLRILVSYPQPLLAMGIAAALRQQLEFEVVAPEVDDVSVVQAPIDVIVTDYHGGLSLAREVKLAQKRCRVMVMTMHDRANDVRGAMEAGVHGYLLLGCSIEELAMGVKALGRGTRYLSLDAAQKMADSLTHESLTARETDVLRLLALGKCNKSIAMKLAITVGTVKGHLRAIFNKLDAASRTEAVGIAVQRGFIDAPIPACPPMTYRQPLFGTHAQFATEWR